MTEQLAMNFGRSGVRSTSRSAYDELKSSKTLGRQARRICWHVMSQTGDCSLQEISRDTGIAINAVSGRVNDCKNAGLLVESTKRPCRVTGRSIIPVMPKPGAVLPPDMEDEAPKP